MKVKLRSSPSFYFIFICRQENVKSLAMCSWYVEFSSLLVSDPSVWLSG